MPDDIEETSSWSCPNGCAGGPCGDGDEELLVGVHLNGCSPAADQ